MYYINQNINNICIYLSFFTFFFFFNYSISVKNDTFKKSKNFFFIYFFINLIL